MKKTTTFTADIRAGKSFTSKIPATPFLARSLQESFLPNYSAVPEEPQNIEIPYENRFRHVYIAGASQHGKSTLLEHMITQDMENGYGLTVLDPKGDLAEKILYRVPPKRLGDCVYLDVEDPVPVDFMSYETENELQTLLANLNETFLRFATMTAGDQWLSILRWTIYTLLVAKHTCFLDIYYFLAHEDRHDEILDRVKEGNVDDRFADIIHYWEKEFPKLKSPREGPILTRMSSFTTSGPLKKILGTPDAELNIFDCMEHRKILLVKLLGAGRQNGNLLGTLITSKILQAAFARQKQKQDKRVPHFLYADEFQNFQTPDFEDILAEAGGFRLGLTLANQGLYQLDNKIKQAIFTNVKAARIAFCLNHEDTHNWKHYLPEEIKPDFLAKLPPYWAFFATATCPTQVSNTREPLPAPTAEQIANANIVRNATHENYGDKRPKRTVGKSVGNRARNVVRSKDPGGGNATNPTLLRQQPEEADS